MNREEQKQTIKDYLKRLGAGEELESVRVDFVKKFQSVDAAEIMNAEQELIKEGTPISEVKRLCDVHSALFHGKTREEQIANAEKATVDSIREQRFAKTAELVKIPGHPLHTFTLENEALAKTIEKCREALKNGHVEYKLIEEVRQLAIHYAKKGDLLYPHLKVKYEISGPSDVMWTVDDEIRDEFAALAKKADSQDDEWKKRFEAALTRADEMIYKEANILFPNCAFNFTDEEWFGIYRDSKDYAECFGVENGVWEDAEKAQDVKMSSISQDEIVMAGGHMTVEQLTAIPSHWRFRLWTQTISTAFSTKVQKCSKDREWRLTERCSPATRRRSNSRYAVLLKNSERERLIKYLSGWIKTVEPC